MEENCLCSIIIPVYNVEKYLKRCLDSVIQQKFNNFEVLLIDDGSTDRSLSICQEYANKDSRIKVFHKENGGVSTARNLGLEKAQGKWITFIDSDDWITKDYFEVLEPLMKNDYELIVFNNYHQENNNKFVTYNRGFDSNYYNISDFAHLNGKNGYNDFIVLIGIVPWNKAYLRSVITKNNLKFDVGMSTGEDACFIMDYLFGITKFYLCNNPLIIWANNPSSVTRTKSFDRIKTQLFDRMVVTRKKEEYIPYGKPYSNLFSCIYFLFNT